jgi:hypothetical protein
MDKLRELVSTKKKESESQFQGKKYARRTELESARLKRVREQEEEERNRKVRVASFMVHRVHYRYFFVDHYFMVGHVIHCRRLLDVGM